jgi:hypothetical protein
VCSEACVPIADEEFIFAQWLLELGEPMKDGRLMFLRNASVSSANGLEFLSVPSLSFLRKIRYF